MESSGAGRGSSEFDDVPVLAAVKPWSGSLGFARWLTAAARRRGGRDGGTRRCEPSRLTPWAGRQQVLAGLAGNVAVARLGGYFELLVSGVPGSVFVVEG